MSIARFGFVLATLLVVPNPFDHVFSSSGGTCVGERCGEDDRPDPFVASISDGDRFYSSSISNGTAEWKETFRGREFAFGVAVDSDSIRFDFKLTIYKSHSLKSFRRREIVQHNAVTFTTIDDLSDIF